MPVESEMVHPRALSFQQQRKVVMLRDKGLSFSKIAGQVVNLEKKHPTKQHVANIYHGFHAKKGRRPAKYDKCDRKPYKVTPEVSKFLVSTLLKMRNKCICTASTLQLTLAKEMNVTLSLTHIRRVLEDKGYSWLPRRKKRVYSKEDRDKRVAFAREVLQKTDDELRTYVTMCMDGVVLQVPPQDPGARQNFCRIGDTHMWRKKGEATGEAAEGGADDYSGQAAADRCVPMWGGVGSCGFGVVAFHKRRKITADEWKAAAIDKGTLVKACKTASGRQRGPYTVVCDNESFLDKYHAANVTLWHVPARSPDLNPVEMFWAWLRKELRKRDLADLVAKRRPVTKAALKARVRAVCSTAAAKRVAQKCHGHFRSAAKKALDLKGRATGC